MGKYQKKPKRNTAFILFFILFAGMIVFAAVKLLGIHQKYAFSEKSYQNLADNYAVTVPPKSDKAESADPTETTAETEPKEYAPISIDFDALRLEGAEIIGWLYCEDTQINYPVTHHANNDYYLHRLPNGQYSGGGSIFLDCKNQPDFSDWNSILYGHHMIDKSMFGSLTEYRKQAYADAHPVLYLLTPDVDYKISVIGGYTTLSTSDSYTVPYDEEGRDALVKKAVDNSQFKPQFQAEPGKKLITLSTCSYEYDEARFVLIGTLTELARPTEQLVGTPENKNPAG